ncbi:hypothetical protein PAPYR_7014 [Paratrimastix pyriformis]|uniref:Uncharacterized protein n=1 Tax=Paratrimastix pyriformis TaxID=342808 RepID=A0ABQ8UGJ3_9EUKA|nr:hypothetical protein PAPYR_7014 [Paratrimastix pyriformis]
MQASSLTFLFLVALTGVTTTLGTPIPFTFQVNSTSDHLHAVAARNNVGSFYWQGDTKYSFIVFNHQYWPDDKVDAFYAFAVRSDHLDAAMIYFCSPRDSHTLTTVWYETYETPLNVEDGEGGLLDWQLTPVLNPPINPADFALARLQSNDTHTRGISMSGNDLTLRTDGTGRLTLQGATYTIYSEHIVNCDMCWPPVLDSPALYPKPLWPTQDGWWEFHVLLVPTDASAPYLVAFLNAYNQDHEHVLLRDVFCPVKGTFLMAGSQWFDAHWEKKPPSSAL